MRDARWLRLLAYVTGSVNQELLARNEYMATENRILRTSFASACRYPTPDALPSPRSENGWDGHIRELGTVCGTAAGLGRIGRVIGMLIKVIEVRLVLALLGFEARPAPGLPAEGGVAGEVASRLGHIVGVRRVGLEEALGMGPVAIARGFPVSAGRRRNAEAQAFLAEALGVLQQHHVLARHGG